MLSKIPQINLFNIITLTIALFIQELSLLLQDTELAQLFQRLNYSIQALESQVGRLEEESGNKDWLGELAWNMIF